MNFAQYVKPGAFLENLEARAREIARTSKDQSWTDSLEAMLSREVALALDTIQEEKSAALEADRGLLKLGTYVASDILQLLPQGRTRYYFDPNIDRRGRLKRELTRIEQERTRIQLDSRRRVANLQRELLEKVETHRQLVENGHR